MDVAVKNSTQMLSAALKMTIEPSMPHGEHHNSHFRAKTSAGSQLFIKLFNDVDYARRSINVETVLRGLDIRTPRLLHHGDLPDGRHWLAYEWQELGPFDTTEEHFSEAGAMLGKLHGETSQLELSAIFPPRDLRAELISRFNRVRSHDPAIADKTQNLWEQNIVAAPEASCLTNGDVSWRNFGIDGVGNVVWYDWECVSWGSPLLDFAKMVDIELADSTVRKIFLRSYHQHAPAIFPWPETMFLVRLWCALGAINYGAENNDKTLLNHGYGVVKQLARGCSVN